MMRREYKLACLNWRCQVCTRDTLWRQRLWRHD